MGANQCDFGDVQNESAVLQVSRDGVNIAIVVKVILLNISD